MQIKVIPGSQSKTPVAQMHFASEHYLSKGTLALIAYGWSSKQIRGSTRKFTLAVSAKYG
jgi:hypothetical protein